jgi:uncharacterized protein GlcG (DUF336 family)
MEKIFQKKSMTTKLVKKLIDVAYNKSIELNCNMSIAIVDESGILKAFLRMEQASILSIDIAINKAYSSAANGKGLSTQKLFEYSLKNPASAVGIPLLKNVTVLGGGFAIIIEGVVVGGIGASGGSTDQDVLVAQAALDYLNRPLA